MNRILAFAGSSRSGSWNRRLLNIAVKAAIGAGAEVTVIDLDDYPMPLMNEDLETREGMPEGAAAFKKLMLEHDGLLIASPEYNGSITPLLKNALDWASRSVTPDEIPLSAYRGKVAALVSASPGYLGGLRGLLILRMLLENLGVIVLPVQKALPAADSAFSDEDVLRDDVAERAVRRVGRKLAKTLISQEA